jgi:flavin reductase (DIM6/NTAB) family NADH-FMN oxidoreductase RutF
MVGRLLEPGPLVLVTSMHRAQHNVMTAGWLVTLGLDPPRLGVAIHPSRLTHELIGKSEMFGLSVPSLDLLNAVHRCGTETGRDRDKFLSVGLTPVDALEIEAPLVEECVAHLECGLVQRLTLSDHDLFVGEVLVASAVEEIFSDRWEIQEGSELLHHVGGDLYVGASKPYRARLPEDEE